LRLPLFLCRVQAGFPSPADDYVESGLDLNRHLIQRPASTFFVRVQGDSMVDAGIHDGDTLIVDRADEPDNGSIVVAALYGELTVKRIRTRDDRLYLMPENDEHDPICVPDESDLVIWGVVQHVIHSTS
jgi:DNA polymerase V